MQSKILLILLLSTFLSFSQNKGTIKIIIKGIEKDKGQIVLCLFNKAEGFPKKTNLSYKQIIVPIKNLQSEILIEDLTFGEYAIAVYQDENKNKTLDVNFFGIPVEKTGASNNPKVLSIPSYSDAKFIVSETLSVQIIIIK